MDRRKELREQYRNRKIVGGVYRILNTENQKYFLASDTDLAGSKNRHVFAVATNLCVNPEMQEDWRRYGPDVFAFESLEEVEKKPEQTEREFSEDLKVLKELWEERFDRSLSY